MNGPEAAVDVGGTSGAPATSDWAALNAGAPEQAASSGPKARKVTVPVGTSTPTPVTVAVSEMGLPRVAAGVAVVARPPRAVTTVTTSASSPSPVASVVVLRPEAYPIGDV